MKTLLDKFKEHKIIVEGKEPLTLERYSTHILQFCQDMEINTKEEFINTKASKVYDWLIKLEKEYNNSPITRNAKLTSVKEIYRYLDLVMKENIDRDIDRIKYAKKPKKMVKNYLTEDDMKNMLWMTSNTRLRAIMAVLQDTGIRFSELTQLTVQDVENKKFYVNGKGNKERVLLLSPNAIKHCNDYIKNKREDIIKRTGVKTNQLFITNEGNQITLANLTKSLKLIAKKLGIEWYKEMSPHKFRHGYITKLLNRNEPIQGIRDIAGHSSISVTNTYAHTSEQELLNIMFKEYENED